MRLAAHLRMQLARVFSVAALITAGACVAPDGDDELAPGGPAGKADDASSDTIRARCGAPAADEAPVTYGDFRWGYTIPEMAARFDEIYTSGKRLAGRAYFDDASGRYLMDLPTSWGGPAEMPPEFARAIRRHLEEAHRLGYAEFPFFPDMGHAHFFIPQDTWETHYRDIPVAQNADRYHQLMADPELQVLYHTAEQLQFTGEDGQLSADRHLQWRFFTRNPVGANRADATLDVHRNLEHSANTVRDLPGHHYYSAGFYVSASERGCFPFTWRGQTRYFDLSLSSMPAN
jgi:hypothetical protein